jgi:hypothetical protein
MIARVGDRLVVKGHHVGEPDRVADNWGPLGPLAGEWEGDEGLDRAYSHAERRVLATPYHERLSMKPFGPVVNGGQTLYGLDYRTAMWRGDEANPFHTEVGYWLWDAASRELVRAFVVPRGITVFASGFAKPDATEFTLYAGPDGHRNAICQNRYLQEHASTESYSVTVCIEGPDRWSYDESTMLKMTEFQDIFAHTDHNTLRRA